MKLLQYLGKNVQVTTRRYVNGKSEPVTRRGVLTSIFYERRGPRKGTQVARVKFCDEDRLDSGLLTRTYAVSLIKPIRGPDNLPSTKGVTRKLIRCGVCLKWNRWSFYCQSCRAKAMKRVREE